MKKILCVILSALLLLSALPALAAGEIKVVVNGEEIYFDQPPVVQNGRTLVPIRGVFEALGYTVSWNGENQQITIANHYEVLRCWLGDDHYEKREGCFAEEGRFDVAPQAMNGRTLVPVRAISEAFDCDVEWNGDTNTVVINDADTIKIGVLQFVQHTALDAANDGFVDAINDSGLKVYIEQKNAYADANEAAVIAEEFVQDSKDLIFAIATPPAIAASCSTEDIPILFTAVTQPIEAGLVQSLEHPGGNISGTVDVYPVEEQLQLLLRRVPDAKSVAVVYNDDLYTPIFARQAEEILTGMGLTVASKSVDYSTDLNELVSSCIGQVQAVYALDVYADFEGAGIPTVYSDSSIGGLITYDINYYNLGYRTGQMAVRYLTGEVDSVGDMPVEQLSEDELDIIVNREPVTEALGITPESLGLYVPRM